MKFFLAPESNTIIVSGRDAKRYLHNRTTININELREGVVRQSLVLSPNGRVEASFFVSKINDESFLIIFDSLDVEKRDEVVKSIFRFKVADQVSWSEVLGKRLEIYSQIDDSEVDSFFTNSANAKIIIDLGFKKILLGDIKEDIGSGDTISTNIGVMFGYPTFGIDFDEKTIASDLPFDIFFSPNKGCYPGQEVVEMATARGRPNKRLSFLRSKDRFAVGASIQAGSEIKNSQGEKIGSCSSAVLNEENYLCAIGFLKNQEHDKERQVEVFIDNISLVESPFEFNPKNYRIKFLD